MRKRQYWIDLIGDGRLVVAGVLTLFGLVLLVAFGVAGLRHVPFLHGLGVPALDQPFMDLHGVAAWCEADAIGIDPAVVQTHIELADGKRHPNFLMNYPPVVLWMRHAGFSPDRVVGFGILLGLAYIGAGLYLMGRCGVKDGVLWAGFLVSPLSLMVIERANLDILVFVCFGLALSLRRAPWASGAPILIAGLLKLYPGAALAAIWMSGNRHGRVWASIFCGMLILYLLTLLPSLSAISGSLQNQSKSCFGADVVVDILFAHGAIDPSVAAISSNLTKLLALFAAISGIGAGFLIGNSTSDPTVSERSQFAFWLAAPMSIVLFVLSNQMDYKWTFLLFLVPVALELARRRDALSHLAKLWIVAMAVYSYWTFFSGEESLRNALLKQSVMWAGFLMTSVLTGHMLRAHRQSL